MNETKRSPAKIIAVILALLVIAAAGVGVWIYFHGIGQGEDQTLQQAAAEFDNAIAADPANAELYMGKAMLYLENGDTDAAALAYAQGYAVTGNVIIAEKLKALGYDMSGRLLKVLPDVSGCTETEAALKLQQMGYLTRTAEDYSETVPAGKVIGSTPAAGETVPVGTEITVTLSLGMPSVEIPDFTTMKLDEINAFCEKNGITLSLNYHDVMGYEKDAVIGQSLTKGSKAEKGAVLILTLASGLAPETEFKFSFNIPASADGVFEFTYYVDGVKDETVGRDARNVGLAANKTLEYTVKGRVGDVKTLSVEVTSSKTNRTDTFVVALITLSEQPTSEVKRMNMGVFSKLIS